jgi:hypothetical protein
MASQKQTKKEINLINATIKLDSLALDSHPIDTKMGNKTQKRTIQLAYIQEGGIIKAPIHLWMFGWLKELFGQSKTKGTTVYLPDKLPAFSLGSAKDILIGRSSGDWELTGDKTVPYAFSPELEPYKLYPFHNYVSLGGKMGSIVKYFYKCNDKTKPVQLMIYSMIPPELIVDNMKNLGKVYGIGPKANGYRLGTFSVLDTKVTKIGEVVL